MIKLNNPKLAEYIRMKDKLVNEGRAKSAEIEKLEARIKICEDKEKAITAKVEPKELGEKVEKLKAEVNKKIKEFEKLSQKIVDEKLKAIPEDLAKEHKGLMAERERAERDRNKIALKVQKVKDRIIPIIQKEVRPKLEKYEDLENVDVVDGEIVVKTFSHLEEFKKRFDEKNKTL